MHNAKTKAVKTLFYVLCIEIVLCLAGLLLMTGVFSALNQSAEVSMSFSTEEKPFAGGDGSQENPYLIANANHLNNVRYFFYHRDENGDFDTTNPTYFLQIDNVNFALSDFNGNTSGNFDPIGTADQPFPGVYEAQGYTISNLNINSSNENVGLFGATSSSAKIYRVSLKNSQITSTGSGNVGAIVGLNNGLVEQTYSQAAVSSNSAFVGGLAGSNGGTIKNSYNAGALSGEKTGGVVGENSGTITGCYNSGSLGTQKGGVIHTQVSGNVARLAYLSTTASEAIYSGSADLTYIKALTQNQLSATETIDLNGSSAIVTELLNGDNASEMATYFYSTKSTYSYPQIWTNAQDENFKFSGKGTKERPHLVTSPQILGSIGKEVVLSELYSVSFGLDEHYVQPVDINFRGIDTNFLTSGNFSPIGSESDPFTGTYKAKSQSWRCGVIEGIQYPSDATEMALFANIAADASVSGIEIKNFTFDIQAQTPFVFAGIAYMSYGTIENCVNSVNLTHSLTSEQIATEVGGASTFVGGIVHSLQSSGVVRNCANLGVLDVNYSGTVDAGIGTSMVVGIAMASLGTVDQCYNGAQLSGGQCAGLVGTAVTGAVISNSFNMGEMVSSLVISDSDTWSCGIVLVSGGGQISNCYNAGKATFGIGYTYTSATNTYFLSGTSSKDKDGGDAALALNANQFAGQTTVSDSSKFLDILGDVWEYDWAYAGRGGVAYQFPQLKSNKAEYWLETAMKVNVEGFHEVESASMFDGICHTYNGISYPSDGWFNLLCDVDYSGSTYNEKGEFSGKLYGNGHTISGVSVERTSTTADGKLGFFSQIHGTAEVKDLTLSDMAFRNKSNNNDSSNGVLAGKISYGARITDITIINGYIRAKNYIGGLAGAIASTGSDGDGNGSITGCRVINTRIRHDDDSTGSDGSPTGGFVGWANNANISACYWAHDNTNGGEDDAGVVGYYKMGGFVGVTEGSTSINSCFAYGSMYCNRTIACLNSTNRSVGGFIGQNKSSSSTISNCYARVTINKNTPWTDVSSSKRIKGFGFNDEGGTWTSNYCLSGQNYKMDDEDAGATELEESAFKVQSSFAGWDFTNAWTMSSTDALPYGMPMPIAAQEQVLTRANIRINTDANAQVQIFSGTTLIKQVSTTSSGAGYVLKLPLGIYQAYIIRNGQQALDSSNVANYAALNIEKVDVTLSSDNQVVDLACSKWFMSGSGNEDAPYIISTIEQFEKLNKFAGRGENLHYVLYGDINLNGMAIDGIKDFRGHFDGQNHIISNYSISSSDSNLGLFNDAQNATIENLGVRDFTLTNSSSDSYYSGALVGRAIDSQIAYCFADQGFLNVNLNAGSLIGSLEGGSARYSYATDNVTTLVTDQTSVSNLGGFVGKATNGSVIEECYSDGAVTGSKLLGGFVADAGSVTIKNAYSRVVVTTSYNGSENSEVGGFAGRISSNAVIENAFMFGTIVTKHTIAAGNFAGTNSSENLKNVYYWNNNSLDGIAKNSTSSAALPLSTIEFNQASSFEEYDFINIWGMPSESSVATGAPVLRNVANAFEITERILGTGTEHDPYIIFNEELLLEVMDLVEANPGKQLYFKLQKDITITQESWSGFGTQAQPFTGVLDGNGKTISGISYSGTSADPLGFFAYASNATIKNLTLQNVQISTPSNIAAAALVGSATNLTVENVSVVGGNISSLGDVGVVAGMMNGGLVGNSTSFGAIISGANVGLVGNANNVEFYGDKVLSITATGTQNAGAIVGQLTGGSIHNLSVTISTLSGTNVGGIAGSITLATIKNVVSNDSTFNGATHLGGIVGVATSSSVIGANVYLSSLSSTNSAGGVAGKATASTLNYNTINTSWTSGVSTYSSLNVGGLVGIASNMLEMKENRLCKLTLTPSASNGAVGQLYGKLTGTSNASKTLYMNITISNSVGATSNALTGVEKVEKEAASDGTTIENKWTYVA